MKHLFLILFLVLGTGCEFVQQINAEIGYSEEELNKGKPKAEAKPEAGAASAKSDLQQRTENWWKNASSLGPAKKTGKNAMVRCRIGSSERFTRPADCAGAGGTIL